MAIATLCACLDNADVFTGVVKIRKGEAAWLIVETQKGHGAVLKIFRAYAERVLAVSKKCRAPPDVRDRLAKAAGAIVAATPAPSFAEKHGGTLLLVGAVAAVAALRSN